MKKIVLAITLLLMAGVTFAQTPKAVLDKCAATVSSKDGATAHFIMKSAQYGDATGTISVKGQKFRMVSGASTMWFDGTTLWTYMKSNEEVNISTPSAQQLQSLNPYNFINLYRKGYAYTMTTSGSAYNVHLTSTNDQHKITEGFVTVDKGTYAPKEIKLLQGTKWTTFTISDLKAEKLDDNVFRFNSAAYPDAEIIDLR